MNLTSLEDLGPLPFTTLTAGVLYQILGPTAKYLGLKGQEWSQKAVENIERILSDALKKLPDDECANGEVPPRVLRSVLNEGAFMEDTVAAGYLGGVLASSKVGSPRDDRGVVMNALISRLSVFQLRLHYVTYTATHTLFRGTDSGFGVEARFDNRAYFGTTGLLAAMGFNEAEFDDPEFNEYSVMTHALYGLSKEDLIRDWEMDWSKGLQWCPSPVGAELYLWANGQGRKDINFLYDKDFCHCPIEEEEPLMVLGRDVTLHSPNGDESFTIDGFDYAYKSRLSCPL